MPLVIKTVKNGIQFSASIQPRSSLNRITGIQNDTLKIRITAPPVQGEANRMCVKFLSSFLNVSPSRVLIISGMASRKKVIQIKGMNEDELTIKLQPAFESYP